MTAKRQKRRDAVGSGDEETRKRNERKAYELQQEDAVDLAVMKTRAGMNRKGCSVERMSRSQRWG